jgi:lysophospholipase L1-like esterase
MRPCGRFIGVVLLAAGLSGGMSLSAQSPGRSGGWVGTWATAVVERAPAPPRPAQADAPRPQGPPPVVLTNVTLRQIVRTSIGGDRVRVVLSNVYGRAPLRVGAAAVGLRGKDSAITAGSGHALTFGGAKETMISAGAILVSDPAPLKVPPLSDLVVDLFLPGDGTSGSLTVHNGARQTNYVSQAGNHAGAADLPVASTTTSWFFLSRVEVSAPTANGVVVTLGDSITDGYNSTNDKNSRWPDHLAARLLSPRNNLRFGVLNVGIDGNKVLRDGLGVSALARLDRDVLVQTGATHVVVLEGINDVGLARGDPRATAPELIAGHRQLIARAHALGLKIYAGTLLPFEGTTIPDYYTPVGEQTRQAVNAWIRTSGEYDGVIDFEAAVKDPKQPSKILAEYDSGDHLHPGDAGYAAMAAAVDLKLFKKK